MKASWRPSKLVDRFWRAIGRAPHVVAAPRVKERGRFDHVIILDGTMSSLEPGRESNAGAIFRLLKELPDAARMNLRYEAGIQWTDWASTRDVINGQGIHKQIVRAYGDLASRYRDGDRIWLFGYSRGAYAVRALSGVIDRIGLLKSNQATERNVNTVYRLYLGKPDAATIDSFRAAQCHPKVDIEMVGVFDTVKALGLRLPVLWRLRRAEVEYHDYHLADCVKRGRHALALNETRMAFEPVLWSTRGDGPVDVDQTWFRGAHPDIGGQLGGDTKSRPLSNIPLVWMLAEAEKAGLRLPENWPDRFPTDPKAPAIGSWSSWGKFFLFRRRRRVGQDPSEHIHVTAKGPDDDWI